jgi:PAS domain S-box-containing protein
MNSFRDDLFAQRVEFICQRTQALQQTTKAGSWQQPQLLLEYLEDLRIALEELQLAEEELRQQNEALVAAQSVIRAEQKRYQELFEFAPDGYLVTDIFGTVQEANCTAASLFNVEQRRLAGKPLAIFVEEDQRQSFQTVLSQLPTIHRIQEWELRLCRRGGETFYAALTVSLGHDQGSPVALHWMIRDVTARKQAEEQLRQLQLQNLELLEVDRLRSQFMAIVSHELRTPMNAILGFSELLLRQFRHDPALANMVERIFRNGKHLLRLIEEILDFSKLKAQRLELHVEEFDLAELAALALEELRPLAEQKALNLQLHVPQPNLMIVNDRTRLRQIITNLLSNAIKFTDIGSVTLEVWSLPEERIILGVRDTGIGIAPEYQTNIFQEFWQVNQTTARTHGGTGLGLAIVQALVQSMQGSIFVDSQPGQGSVFRVELPRYAQS